MIKIDARLNLTEQAGAKNVILKENQNRHAVATIRKMEKLSNITGVNNTSKKGKKGGGAPLIQGAAFLGS